MERYRHFRPTPFDSRGLLGEYHGIAEFLVASVSRTRDSGILDNSNFEVFLDALGGESDTVQVHRFGHWGPGWFELILIDPADADAVRKAEDMENRLADYPLLDEEDHSRREYELACNTWHQASIRERVEYLQNARQCIFAARRDDLPQDDNGRLFEALTREC